MFIGILLPIAGSLLLPAGHVCGQVYPFIPHGTAAGLPERHVTAVAVDHRGFLWAGLAERGLVRYDGQEFLHFGEREAGIAGGVFAVATDGDRWLFAGTNAGVRVLRLDIRANDQADTAMTGLLEPIKGPVRALRFLRDRRLYVETLHAAWLFSLRDSSLRRCAREPHPANFLQPRLPGMELRGMARDCNGDTWVATDSGLVQLGDTGHYRFGPAQGLPTRNITSVCIDREAGIWCGSDQGLFHYVPQRLLTITSDDSAAVNCMVETKDRVLFLGTRGAGVFRLFGGSRLRVTTRDGLPSDVITGLHELDTGELLVATDRGAVVWGPDGVTPMPETLRLPDPRVHQVYRAKDRSYWFATMGGLVHWNSERSIVFGVRDGLPSAQVRCLAEDAYGHIYVGTSAGVARVRATGGGTVEPVRELLGLHVTALHLDGKERLWTGTAGGGVMVSIRGGHYRLGSAQGLPGGAIAFIGEDNYGSLYFGHHRGVSVLPQSNIQFLLPVDSLRTYLYGIPPAQLPFLRAKAMFSLTRSMGMHAGALQEGAVLRDRAGRMWFGGERGASCYNPARPPSVGRWTPPQCRNRGGGGTDVVPLRVILADVRIDDRHIRPRESITLGEDERVLHARLLLPTFRNPGQLRFLYRLRGLEYTWHESADGGILYTGIESGSYELEVQASIGEGIWTERQILLRIDVTAPVTQRWWFLLLLLLLAAGAGMLLQRSIIRWRGGVSRTSSEHS